MAPPGAITSGLQATKTFRVTCAVTAPRGYPFRMSPIERVDQALCELGIVGRIVTFDQSTATAENAAAAVGCALGQIVKTLVFLADGRPTVVLVAGDRQVDTTKLARIVGVGRKRLKMGTPGQVRDLTGFDIGGVAPVGMPANYDTITDESLQRFDQVWAAAGSPTAVFGVSTSALVEAVHGQWADITKDAP